MSDAAEPFLDESWLNDRSDYQLNYVHGLRNPVGLHVQYTMERVDGPPGHRVVGEWAADERHMGFPGVAHGGLVVAILDDAMGRCAALRHRWVVSGRIDTRFRAAAPIGVTLRVEGWITRYLRRQVNGRARMLLADGTVIAEADGTYLPIPRALEEQMLTQWPGFAEYLGREDAP
ncbi:MAG TPA: PaaI family thioesterase [Candidatus Dormibacteraeota bacterium]|nr:PaaI family thioesterase [Candidatus Dormibacteraeota bacterium]